MARPRKEEQERRAASMRARVAGFTLAGSSKYFDSVGRDTPHAWAKSSIVRCVFSAIDLSDPLATSPPERSGRHQSCGRCPEAAMLDRTYSVKFSRFPIQRKNITCVKLFIDALKLTT